jgi:uncharacterized protein (DUF342 family)
MSSALPDNDKLNTSELILPAYVLVRPEGVFINLSPPPAQDILLLFVDRLFSNKFRFAGLDYAHFIRLLYGDASEPFSGGATEVRIAGNIVRFPPERMELYKGVKIMGNGERAEYMFGPVFLEVVKDEPIYGEPGEDGVIPIIEYKQNVEKIATQLDFDEFIASMWLKGVRFGINADGVRDAIKKGTSGRISIAFQLEPTDGKDAEVVEESDHLRQDNAPMILANGKADLRRAKNRFPQIAKNAPLLRKIPRVLGKPGYRVTGTAIEPRIPEDLDLGKLGGEGTRIEQSPKGELLVAGIDGFLVLDEGTGEISVATKIENKGGISAKSTGDIKLTVDDYTEHGEVQEGRVVEGKHMTFLSSVFGTVISQGGDIELHKSLSGGCAQSVGGNIIVKEKAINSTLEAWDGKISAEFAEGCLIISKSVSIGRAVNCEIVAEELQLGIAEGCAIAGKNLQIASSNARKNRETVISMLLPDIPGYDRRIAEAKTNLVQIEQAIQAKNKVIAATQSDPGFSKYLAIAEKVRTKTITFTPEQQIGWQKIVNQFAPIMRGSEDLMKKCLVLEDAIKRLAQERTACGDAGEHCKIEEVLGDTVVRKISSNQGMSLFRKLPQQELRIKLRQLGDEQERIFSDHKGSLEWHFEVPALPAG